MAQDSCFGTSTMKPAAAVAEETRRERAVRLFGVSILAVEEVEGVGEVMRKCSSTGNLVSAAAIATGRDQAHYLSDSSLDRFPRRRRRGDQERKRGFFKKKFWRFQIGPFVLLLISIGLLNVSGVPWTEEEHRSFLAGLENLGKGDWRGISREFVITRTPTQVASHAQKFFMRKNNPSASARKRRSSLFDVVISCQGDATTTKAAERKTEEGNLPHLIRPASSIETKDLELRIALPGAHNLNKLCTHGAAGAISAI